MNSADMPVARAAVHYKAIILTQDAPLVAECLADEISARFPWSIIVQGGAPPIDEILRIVRPGRHIGTIFARVTPGGWLGMANSLSLTSSISVAYGSIAVVKSGYTTGPKALE